MKKRFNSRGFGRMMDAFGGAPRGSIRLTANAVTVQRDLDRMVADPSPGADAEALAKAFQHVIHGDLEVDGKTDDFDRNLEDLEFRCRNITCILNRVRNTALKVARFRKTGDPR